MHAADLPSLIKNSDWINQPSFKDITLYQLCYWKVTRIYGLTPEEIEDLLTNPDPHIPSHHQVDPRIIKVYLTG
jgi:hypothetical protein